MNIEEFNKYNNYVESANKLLKKVSSEKVMGELFKLINNTSPPLYDSLMTYGRMVLSQ